MAAQGSSTQLLLVGIPEIARISHVGPSAVGNWRKRHPDFPTPKVQAPSGALFDLGEIETWLVEKGKIAGRVPAITRLSALTSSARGTWSPDEVAAFCVACLVYFEASERAEASSAPDGHSHAHIPIMPAEASWTRVRNEERPAEFVRRLRGATERIEELNPDLAGLLVPGLSHVRQGDGYTARGIAIALDDATGDVTPRFALLDEVAPRFAPAGENPRSRLLKGTLAELTETDRFAAEFSTPDDVSYLLSQLTDSGTGTIFDPAVGEGGLLLLAALWQPANPPPELVGVEINEAVCRIARSRCYLYELTADIRHGNALTMDLTQLPRADSVVLDPPYAMSDWGNVDVYLDPRWRFGAPSPQSADFAWLQIATLQLKPAGRAAVVLPTASLSGGGRELQIRRALIKAGVVEGVVLLPPRLRADTSIPLSVWLLRSPDAKERSDEVLLVDASELGKPGRSRFSLEEQTIDRLGQLVRTWRLNQEIDAGDGEIAVAVSVHSITDANLNPKRHRRSPEIDVEALEQSARQLRERVKQSAVQANDALAQLAKYLEG